MSGDSERKFETLGTNVSVSSDSDSDDDPFDFVAKFRRLKKKQMKEKSNTQSSTSSNTPKPKLSGMDYIQSIISKVDSTLKSTTDTSKVAVNNKRKLAPSNNNRKKCTGSEKVIGPVICIGDFDDGYDIPPPKFPASKVPDSDFPVVPIKSKIDDEEDDYCYEVLNRIMNIKVYWRKMRTHCFPIRTFQSIESIYEHFAKLEDIQTEHVSLVLRKKLLSPTDSPHSMKYRITDFIDGDIVFYKSPYDTPEITETEEKEEEEEEEEEVTFRIKQKDVKYPILISIKKSDRMWVLYLKLAEKLGLDVESFILEFDGDKIKKSDNMERLDLEGDECFELFEKKKL